MNFDELKQILEMVREHELTEFELERDGLKIRIKKNGAAHATGVVNGAAMPPQAIVPVPQQQASEAAAPIAVPAEGDLPAAETDAIELAVVKSPIVGTFYRSAEPGSAAFVEVGQRVKKGQVLCIIEAMKLMNEIDSEYEGEITNVYVENGQPVQYGERLFAIRTA
jgi:acetyl-CoA carboxylase biotin carboxyl carrier protein